MIESTCIECGDTFTQPRKSGRRRKRCSPCRPGYRSRPEPVPIWVSCTVCDRAFESAPKPYLRKYCSERCRVRGYRIQNPDKVEEQKLRARATSCRIYVEPCDICGELKTWRSARRSRRTCSRSCENVVKAQRQRERYAANAESERERIYAWRQTKATPCVECGASTSNSTAQRCGDCQRRAAGEASVSSRASTARHLLWLQWKASTTSPPRLLEMGRRGRIEVASRRSSGVAAGPFYAGRCAKCSSPFVTPWRGAVYCSSRCSESGYWISPLRRVAIYDRDGWVCQICADPIPFGVLAPHPLAPSLDHIIPQSKRPGDHRDDNLRLAHLLCNSIRGDESNANWRDLIPSH